MRSIRSILMNQYRAPFVRDLLAGPWRLRQRGVGCSVSQHGHRPSPGRVTGLRPDRGHLVVYSRIGPSRAATSIRPASVGLWALCAGFRPTADQLVRVHRRAMFERGQSSLAVLYLIDSGQAGFDVYRRLRHRMATKCAICHGGEHPASARRSGHDHDVRCSSSWSATDKRAPQDVRARSAIGLGLTTIHLISIPATKRP